MQNNQTLKNNPGIQHNTTKTNMDLNYEPEKNLILEMETENHESKDQITITPIYNILNNNQVAAEIINTVAGSFGLAATAPFTAFLAGTILVKKEK